MSFPKTGSKTLLAIPGELRNRIYEMCLLEDENVYPYDYMPCGCDCPKSKRVAPSVALLLVNRQINTEATPLLYGNVTFHLETGYTFMRFCAFSDHICMFSHPPEDKLFSTRHQIRSLSFKFVPEMLERGPHASRVRDFWDDDSFRIMSTRRKSQQIHTYVKSLSSTVWEQAAEVICDMRGLKKLQLNIDQAFCPQGCCRMVGHVIKALKDLRKKEGFKVTVLGDLNVAEENTVIGGLKYDASLYDRMGEDHDLDEDEDEDTEDSRAEGHSTEEDIDEEDGTTDTDDDSEREDEMPGLREMSVDSEMEDTSSDVSSVSSVSFPADMFDSTDVPGKSSDAEEEI